MSSSSQSRSIIVAGGTGNVGGSIVRALCATGIHKVSVISRPESKVELPADVVVHRGSYEDESFLAEVCSGQDVLVDALGFGNTAHLHPLISRAAIKAGVPYILPTEFGSDISNEKGAATFSMIHSDKIAQRKLIEELGGSWIGIITNPWFDMFMKMGLGGIDIKNRTATIWDGIQDVKAPFTTLPHIGKSVAGLLSQPDTILSQHKNKAVFVSSFYVSQNDILQGSKRVTGTTDSDWNVKHVGFEEEEAAHMQAMAAGKHQSLFTVLIMTVFKDGFGGDYQSQVDYDLLGVQQEDLDDVIRELI